jgi:transcription antitermination factor NusG
MADINNAAWFVLRVTYGRGLKIKEYLDAQNIRNFIPMHYVADEKAPKKRRLAPVIQNLIFVYASRKTIDAIKREPVYEKILRYMMDKASKMPVVVPDKQMQDFISISSAYDEAVVYIDPAELLLKKGDRVRITTGIWEGVEGEFVRIKGDRRVVVSIQGIMAVATAFIHPAWIEPVKQNP